MENHRSFCRYGGCLDNHPHCGVELCCAAIGGPPRAIERGGHHDRITFLGLGLGRHGAGAGDSHHGRAASDLRPHGILEAHRALAERLKPLRVWWTSILISGDSNTSLEPIPEENRMNLRIIWLTGALSLLACASPPARAWGCKGHQTVALLAEKRLTPEARQMVQKILADNPIDPKLKRWCGNATMDLMVDASTWPDDVRNERNNGPWHYIDIPLGKHKGSLKEYCTAEGCITLAIEQQRALLKDKSADP